MKITRSLGVIVCAAWILAGCSKQPETATAQTSLPEPDNSVTRYAQGLADDERHAKVVEDKANQVIAQQNEQINQASKQMGNN